MDDYPVVKFSDAAKFDQQCIAAVTEKIFLFSPEHKMMALVSVVKKVENGNTVALAEYNGCVTIGVCNICADEIVIKDLCSNHVLHFNRKDTAKTIRWIFPIIKMRIQCLTQNKKS